MWRVVVFYGVIVFRCVVAVKLWRVVVPGCVVACTLVYRDCYFFCLCKLSISLVFLLCFILFNLDDSVPVRPVQ